MAGFGTARRPGALLGGAIGHLNRRLEGACCSLQCALTMRYSKCLEAGVNRAKRAKQHGWVKVAHMPDAEMLLTLRGSAATVEAEADSEGNVGLGLTPVPQTTHAG